jgi:hypothetical protein
MAHAKGVGMPVTLMGADGAREVVLSELTEASLLFVGRETLRHLKQNHSLWKRVVNPTSVDDEESGIGAAREKINGHLDAILSSVSDAALAAPIPQGKFRVVVVDDYREAVMRVTAIRAMLPK